MSSFEKLFWLTIALFLSIYIYLEFNAQKAIKVQKRDKPIFKELIKIVDDNQTVIKNLQKASPRLQKELNKSLKIINLSIDKNIDLAFKPVFQNIDTFLDFHYSVIGEYIELGSAATGEFAKSINKRLFKDRFYKDIKIAKKNINNDFEKVLDIYISDLNKTALSGVEIGINRDLLYTINKEIDSRVKEQKIKTATFISVAIIAKIATKITSKIALKSASKAMAKGAGKIAAKSASSASAAASGTICGPLFWICSPVAATIAWFGTDKIIIEADEYLNRDKFKKELTDLIDKKKEQIKARLKDQYKDTLISLDHILKETLKSKKVKKRVRVIEKF